MYKQEKSTDGSGERKVYVRTWEHRYRMGEDDNSIYEVDIDCMDKTVQQNVAEKE